MQFIIKVPVLNIFFFYLWYMSVIFSMYVWKTN